MIDADELDAQDPQIRSLVAGVLEGRQTRWTIEAAMGAYALVRAANFDYASPEKIVALLGAFLDDPFDEVMEAIGAIVVRPSDRKRLPQVGEVRLELIERRQRDRDRERSNQRRGELPAPRRDGLPWFLRLQAARMHAGLPPGDPTLEAADVIEADCERFGIHRDTLAIEVGG